MPISTLLKLLLSLTSSIAQYAHAKQLIETGEARAMLEGIKNANDAIARANTARANAGKLSVESDPNNRDAK